MTCNYLRYFGGQNSDNTPILMNPKDGQHTIVIDGFDDYELRFNNNLYKDKELEEKFSKQFFIIGDIKFVLVQRDDKDNNIAIGHRFSKNSD